MRATVSSYNEKNYLLPHLLYRYNYYFQLNGEPLEWTKLVELLKIDLQGEGFRLLPKLTYEHLHLNPSLRMKVKLAAQV